MKLQSDLGAKPLWSQVYDIFNERIEKGEYKVGEVLPSEIQIMKEFDVSRVTVRQAMDKLLSEKKILRKRGKGTIVLEKQDKVSTFFQSTFSSLKENESNHNKCLLGVKYVKAPIKVAELFRIPDNTPVLCVKREGVSEMKKILDIHTTYINPIVGMDDQTDFTQSLYEQYKKFGFGIESVSEMISASIATSEERKAFGIKNGPIALMSRERKGFHNDVAVEYTISQYLSDGYALFINNI